MPSDSPLAIDRPDKRTGLTAMFVQNDEIRNVVGSTRVDDILDYVITAIDALGIRENQSHFLIKHYAM
jgi:hypothetical protein